MSNSVSGSRLCLLLVAGLLTALMAFSFKPLATNVRFGLEFRGGYEIYYVVSPGPGKTEVTQQDLLETANILRQRTDTIGMAEPEIHIEGANHIRLKLAGLTSAQESRSLLGSSDGLPTTLTEKYTQTVGSVLGKTALKETVQAGLIGIACIFLLLIGLYRGLGLVAAFGTVIYLWLLLIVFNLTHATLSLSAVVAFVLGIGMAADASIICFERVREELSHGSLRTAVQQGFRGSFHTIRDANLVTAMAMLALFIGGIGPIQGFSITMLVSIVISILTNYFLVRQLSLWLATSNILPRAALIGAAKSPLGNPTKIFNFSGFGRIVMVGAIFVIASGALYYKAHGFNLDIDFTAGTALDIDVDRAINQDVATKIMGDAGTVPATVTIGGQNNTHIAARFDEVLKPENLKKIIAAFQSKYSKVEYEENTADPGVARDFASRAIFAIILAFACITAYITWRFSWAVAVATILPILQDMMLVSAIFSLFKFEIDVTYIAGLLTIIGYSLNDKIVIFGRIFENLKKSPDAGDNLASLVNLSIRQTLGRSVYTVLTVVLASACLYQFACEPLQMFSLAILLGLLSGACSSIFMSSYIWLSLQPRKSGETKMLNQYLPANAFRAVMGLIVLASAGGWVAIPSTASRAATQVADAGQTNPAPLGDLSVFIKISNDTLALVKANDFKTGKDRITDLETAWDNAEEQLRPKDSDAWTSVDKSIDRALHEVRSSSPDQATSIEALNTLIAKMNNMQPAQAQ